MTQGKVISLGMKEMKWTTVDLSQIMSVKEQRVDGSSVIHPIYWMNTVRCTLVTGKPALERN